MAQEKNIAHGSRINLNTASREELAQVPGSSEQCADDIIRLREERGGLKSVEEIDDLKGFGEAPCGTSRSMERCNCHGWQ